MSVNQVEEPMHVEANGQEQEMANAVGQLNLNGAGDPAANQANINGADDQANINGAGAPEPAGEDVVLHDEEDEQPDDLDSAADAASVLDMDTLSKDIEKIYRGESIVNESSLSESIIDNGIKLAYIGHDTLLNLSSDLVINNMESIHEMALGTCIIPLEIQGLMFFLLAIVVNFKLPLTIGISSMEKIGFHMTRSALNCPKLIRQNMIIDAVKYHYLSSKRTIFSIRSKIKLNSWRHSQYDSKCRSGTRDLDSLISNTYSDQTSARQTIDRIYFELNELNCHNSRIEPDIFFLESHNRENSLLSDTYDAIFRCPPNYLIHEDEFETFFSTRDLQKKKKKLQLSRAQARHVHLRLGHLSSKKIIHILRGEYKLSKATENLINSEIERCNTCAMTRNKPVGHKIALPRARCFNDYVDLDIKICKDYNILYIVDSLTSFLTAKIIPSKESNVVYNAFISAWVSIFGIPHSGIASDCGNEFTSSIFQTFCASNGIRHYLSSPGYPEGNGKVERCHFQCDKVMQKIKLDCPSWSDERCLERAVWAYNSSPAGHLNIAPLFAVTGQGGRMVSLDSPNPSVQNETEENVLGNILHSLYSARKAILEAKYSMISRKLLEGREFPRKNYDFFPGQTVFYYCSRKLVWLIGKIVNFYGSTCDLKTTNGFLKNVPQVRIKPFYDKWTNSEQMHDLSYDSSTIIDNTPETEQTDIDNLVESQLKETDRHTLILDKDEQGIESDRRLIDKDSNIDKTLKLRDEQVIDNTDKMDDELEEIDSQVEIDIGQFSDMSLESPSLNSHIVIVFKSDPHYHYDVIVKKLNKSILTFIDKFDNKTKAHKRKDLMFKYLRCDRVDRGPDQGDGDGRDGQIRQREDHADLPVRQERHRDGGGRRQPPPLHVPHHAGPIGPQDRSSRDEMVHSLHVEEPRGQRRRHLREDPGGHGGRAARPNSTGGWQQRPQVPLCPGDLWHDPPDAPQDRRDIQRREVLHPTDGDSHHDQGGGQIRDGHQHIHPGDGDHHDAAYLAVRPVEGGCADGRRPGDPLLLQEDEVHPDGGVTEHEELPLRHQRLYEDVLHNAQGYPLPHGRAQQHSQPQRGGAHRSAQLHNLEGRVRGQPLLHEEPDRPQRHGEEEDDEQESRADELHLNGQQGDAGRHRQVKARSSGPEEASAESTAPLLEGADQHVPLQPGRPWQRRRKRRKRRKF